MVGRRDGARPARLRQADPGAGRSRPAAADQGRRRLHRGAPDVMLTEIHRQAGESAIIRLATMARQGEPIPYGDHDDHVWKMRRTEVAARAAAARRPGDLRPQRDARPAQRRHETCRGLCRRASGGRAARRSSASRTATTSAWSTACSCRSPISRTRGTLAFSATRDAPRTARAIAGRHRFYKGHYDDHVAPRSASGPVATGRRCAG